MKMRSRTNPRSRPRTNLHRYGLEQNEQESGYEVERLTKREYATLEWLADHGYDAGILKAAGVRDECEDDGSVQLGRIPEHKAWDIQQVINDDPHAFLASNGSSGLAEKLLKFVNSIV